ncbi:MAG: hypothetical protein MUC79_08145 [Thiobacillaceae bacterium]|jgi:CHAT domain-containing protein|nr:hypothetical protein [Thiobacillaceae bacterium]
MDIPLTATHYPTTPPAPGQAGTGPDARRARRPDAAPDEAARQARDAARQAEAARAPRAENLALEARIKFEYEQSHRVMRVHDSQGVLIYQVPPKGALQLILQEEDRPARVQDQA